MHIDPLGWSIYAATAGALAREFGGWAIAPLAGAKSGGGSIGDIEALAPMVSGSAWQRGPSAMSSRREAALAKLVANEGAQRAAYAVAQPSGSAGVQKISMPEGLCRDVRALRIYEGASEVQRLIIGGELIRYTKQESAT